MSSHQFCRGIAGWAAAGLALGGVLNAGMGDYPIRPVPFTAVRVEDDFWSPRLATNRVVTIPYAFEKCEETGRIDNFAFAGKLAEGKFKGIYFNDSDVYKVIEGAAYALAIARDAKLEGYVDEVIRKIAAAQEPDGYLYTARTLCGPDYQPPGGPERWSDIASGHELYNVGHLYEAAVAYYQATGKRSLLEVALRNADLICQVFGPGRNTHPPGHQEIEIGLVRLYRVTGEAKYLEQAKFFLDARGRAEGRSLYGPYSQDHVPVTEQREAVGHAVRAGYLYCGMADVAALTGDRSYLEAIDHLWQDVIAGKLYVTGGIGARGGGEAFGEAYELPNRTAYCETCAAIANALWNHRMFLLHGDARYVDVLERILYNGFLSGISMNGDRFFYPNRLESHRGERRSPWFDCACCPANVCRFLPSIPGYVYATRGPEIFVNLYLGGVAALPVSGQSVSLRQKTRYPWEGRIDLAVEPERPAAFALRLRIPGWAQNQAVPGDLYRFATARAEPVTLEVNGSPVALEVEDGFARVLRTWSKGDVVTLKLPMPVRRVLAHDRVRANRGRVALQRGPVVFCAEAPDHGDTRVLSLVLADDAPLESEYRSGLLNGVRVIRSVAREVRRRLEGGLELGPEHPLTAIPYYAWAHREPGPMAVWIARDPEAARPLPAPTVAYSSKVTVSGGTGAEALNDQLEPNSSIDHENPFLHWWPRKGTREWVQYEFREPTRVSGVEVYWFDDTGIGECRLPKSWRLLARVGGDWREVEHPSGYGVGKDTYNRTTFDPVTAEALRLEVQLAANVSAGIHEWRVNAAPDHGGAPGSGPAVGAPLTNTLSNASFEQGAGERPRSWRPQSWGGRGSFDWADGGRTGERSVRITSEAGADIGWATTVAVEPYARYRLSGWIKTEDVRVTTGRGALLNLHDLQPVATPAVTGTRDWTRVEVPFETDDQESVQVNCLFGGWGLATGRAWYDDLQLEKIGQKDIPAARIAIDAGRVGQPISPYVYGQFIEHLGRCIYGGIWAEMLEDRKFYHAVGTANSPWKPVGPAGSVSMTRDDVFVGEHAPRVTLGGGTRQGLSQGGLGLETGEEYVGRIWIKGSPEAGPVEVSLVWGDGAEERQTIRVTPTSGAYAQAPLRFASRGNTRDGRLEITSAGVGHFLVGPVSLMPADNVQGMRADTLELLRQLDAPVYRWPGGNFVSGYDWRDGIGDPDRRPPRRNPAWQGVEHDDFGIDEFMTFCRLLGTEAYVVVNSGLGRVQSAVEELEYINGPSNTALGGWRARNGHPEPYRVKFWGIGNEMYGGWQLGHMPLEEYVRKHNLFARAMRGVDASICIIGVGAVGAWTEGMFRHCADSMDLISEHFYCQERSGLSSHVRQIPESVRGIADAHRRYRREIQALQGKDIRIALDEWNYWYGPHVFGELGTRYFLKDGLGIAAGLHEMFRHSDLYYMANYAQTVNVIGAIKTSKTAAAFETTGLVLRLYRQYYGSLPVVTQTAGRIDAQAAWTSDRTKLTLGIVNPTRETQQIPLELVGARLAGKAQRWQIAGPDPMAYNDPDEPPRVAIEADAVEGIDDSVTVLPCSVTLLELEAGQ